MKINGIEDGNGVAFENWCFDLFKKASIAYIHKTRSTNDYGADLYVIYRGDRICVQCKYYSNNVGIAAVQEVNGSLSHYSAVAGVVITNSEFTPSAIQGAKEQHVLLINGKRLKSIMDKPSLILKALDGLLRSIDPEALYRKRNDKNAAVLLNSIEVCERYGMTWDHFRKYFLSSIPHDKIGRYYWFNRSVLSTWESETLALTWKYRGKDRYYDLRKKCFVEEDRYHQLLAEYEKRHEAERLAERDAKHREELRMRMQTGNQIAKVVMPETLSAASMNSMQRLMAVQRKKLL